MERGVLRGCLAVWWRQGGLSERLPYTGTGYVCWFLLRVKMYD